LNLQDFNWAEFSERISPELLAEAIKIGTRGSLILAVAQASALSPAFHQTVKACLEGAKQVPLGVSPTREHAITKTALIGGIQLGLVLGLLITEGKIV